MKSCILLLVSVLVAVQALTDEQKAKLKTYHDECKAASGASDDVINKARQGDFTDDPKFKEHLFCVAKKLGFQNEAGDVQVEVLKTKLGAKLQDEAKAAALVAKCAVKKATPQDTAYDTVKCYYEETHESIS